MFLNLLDKKLISLMMRSYCCLKESFTHERNQTRYITKQTVLARVNATESWITGI